MKRNHIAFFTVFHLVLIVYFVITTAIYFMSINEGNDGISIQLFGGGDDGNFYWNQALNVAEGKNWVRTSIYPYLIGILIKVTGIYNPYLIRIFNYTAFILLMIVSIKLIKIQYLPSRIESNNRESVTKSYIIILIIYLFYLSMFMNISLSIYRDVWIYFLYALSVYLTIKIYLNKNVVLNLFFLGFSLFFLYGFREYAVLAFIIANVIFELQRRITKENNKKILIILFIVFTVYYTFYRDLQLPLVGMSLSDALQYRNSAIESHAGGSQMWINLNQSNVLLFFINYFMSAIGNFIGPLPQHISGFSTILVFIFESIPMIIILYYVISRRKSLSKIQNYIMLHAFTWIGLIGMINDNLGTATRLRVVAWVLIFTVFSTNIVKNKEYSNL